MHIKDSRVPVNRLKVGDTTLYPFTILPGNRYTDTGLQLKVGSQVTLNWMLIPMIREESEVRQAIKS